MLTVAKINAAKPKDKPYKIFDSHGLYLFISTSGGKLWRHKYRINKKEKLLSYGSYPDISLSEARDKRDASRKMIANGIDPGMTKQDEKEAALKSDTLEDVAREWHREFYHTWSAEYAQSINDRLELNIFPWIGKRPVGNIKPTELLEVLGRIRDRGALETVRRVKTICSQIWRYAISTGRAEYDITATLKGAFAPPNKKHHAAIVEPRDAAKLLRDIDAYQGGLVVKCALQLAPLVYVRPGELRRGEWSEIDWNSCIWTIPGKKMKMKEDHIVPLSRQAIKILKTLQPLTGSGQYLFPSQRSTRKPMSENAVLAALRSLGYSKEEMTGHGFRAMARTILDEVLHIRVEYIEHQLAHTVKDPNGRAYNRTTHLAERKKMMQTWADYLDGLKSGAKVLPFKRSSLSDS